MNTHDKIWYYESAAFKLLGHPTEGRDLHEMCIELDKFLGIKEYQNYAGRSLDHDYPMSDDLKQLLVNITGPNGKAILRAYRIRKGLVK